MDEPKESPGKYAEAEALKTMQAVQDKAKDDLLLSQRQLSGLQESLVRRLQVFLADETTDQNFTISNAQIATAGPAVAEELNALLKYAPAGFTWKKVGDAIIVTKTALRGPQTGLAGDVRVSEEASDIDNPFRPRYRKLSMAEAELHDDIKNKAFALWLSFDAAVEIQRGNLPESADDWSKSDHKRWGAVNRDRALARTALEDAVMRAVRALTA
jgi:hypothetical protein